jgi:hypothetical protein
MKFLNVTSRVKTQHEQKSENQQGKPFSGRLPEQHFQADGHQFAEVVIEKYFYIINRPFVSASKMPARLVHLKSPLRNSV